MGKTAEKEEKEREEAGLYPRWEQLLRQKIDVQTVYCKCLFVCPSRNVWAHGQTLQCAVCSQSEGRLRKQPTGASRGKMRGAISNVL